MSRLDLIEIVPKVKVWVEYWLSNKGSFEVSKYDSEEDYLKYKSGGETHPNLTHLKVEAFEYEPKPKTK